MLNQIDIYTNCDDLSGLRSELSVKIHGAIMAAISTEYAEKLHRQEYHPFSIFAIPAEFGPRIRVSTLNDEAYQIIEILDKLKDLTIYGVDESLKIVATSIARPIAAYDINKYITDNVCNINFITPAVVKTNGKPSCQPDLEKFFYSTICKYNAFENDEISYTDFVTAFKSATIGKYNLEGVTYNVSGHIFPGMIGYINIKFPNDAAQANLLKKVFGYATYSGIGGKTSLGMGGVIVHHD